MEYLIDKDGHVIKQTSNSCADKYDDYFNETFYGDDKTNPSLESLKAAMKVRNKRKKELVSLGMNDITCIRLVDDTHFNPPKTVAYIVNALKKEEN